MSLPHSSLQLSPPTSLFHGENLLEFVNDDWEALADLVEIYQTFVPSQSEQLERAAAEDDLLALQQLGHKFRGTLGSYQATEARATATRMEQAARDGNLSGAQELALLLVTQLDELSEALTEFCRGHSLNDRAQFGDNLIQKPRFNKQACEISATTLKKGDS